MAKNVTLVAAEGVLTIPADPAATDTITIGDITYTFIATPGAAYDVDVGGAGANKAGSLANLAAAINASGSAGATTYFAGTLVNPYVSAEVTDTDEIVVTARVPGAQGNGIATSTSETDIVFGAVTLEGGSGHLPSFIDGLLELNPVGAELQLHLKELTEAAD